ncbi:MAG TPA: nitroreductase family deazaflavin-dependent oxidoreductase [Pseudonocardiaceae bacterium]|jgi:deazaflavin-dependent oxidoreductase (nitroreductase family)|nr:nitroreductase family deazaflavin-dependent oxidoreductase [Pseudonocardiaceae bacterium]
MAIRLVGKQPWFPQAFGWIVPLDTLVHRATRGRFGLTDLGGVDSLLLTTVGRRSGDPREVALTCAPYEDSYLVAGSNWGGATHPAWSTNLLANPDATVTAHGRSWAVRARLLDGDERARMWEVLAAHWPPYRVYAARAGREIRVFILERV